MNPKASILPSSLLLFSFFLLFSSAATAFNITRLLGRHPEFSTFNDYLTKTHLYEEINHRRTITVLALDNGAMSTLSGNSLDVIKKVLSTHVILDYYDVQKVQKLSKKTAIVTTLFQSSGLAQNQQGFLNVTDLSTGDVAFGSAVKGAELTANLVKSVAAQPYNISVLQISSPIVAPGLNVALSPPAPTPPVAPAAPPEESVPVPAPSEEIPSPDVAPAPSDDSEAPADAPADAFAPGPYAPFGSPPAPVADEAKAPSPSSATRVAFGACIAVVLGLVSSLVAC